MATIRIHATAELDGEIRVRGLPLRKGEEADVIVLTEDDHNRPDAELLAILQHDPSWAWLRDEHEDVYTEGDVR